MSRKMRKPALRDGAGMIGRVLAGWIGISARRPRKWLPAVALGFGLGLLVGGGLWFLYPAYRLVGLIIALAGLPCIGWALWPQDDIHDDE